MATRKESRFRLSSLQLKKPGLLELLFRRSLTVGPSDFLFHFGVWGSVITGLIMESAFLVNGVADYFAGMGGLLSWVHGITGLFILAGGIGFIVRYIRNPFFRLAYGRVFFLDLAFLGALAAAGTMHALPVFGFTPVSSFFLFTPAIMQALPASFTSVMFYYIRGAGTIHVLLVFSFVVVSFLGGGAVRHAVGSIAWRLTDPESKPTSAMVFRDACGKDGRCVEVCPAFEAFNGNIMEAPVIKLRKYYEIQRSRKLTPSEVRYVSEQMAVCAQCNLCAGVCPYSFNYVAMYYDMLAHAQELARTA
jgi:ferredoxin